MWRVGGVCCKLSTVSFASVLFWAEDLPVQLYIPSARRTCFDSGVMSFPGRVRADLDTGQELDSPASQRRHAPPSLAGL